LAETHTRETELSTTVALPNESSTSLLVKDPLLTRTPVTYDRVFFPYGFPVRLQTNSQHVMEAAEISWATYRQKFDRPELNVRCFTAVSKSPACTEPPVFRSQRHLLSIVADGENFAALDLNQGFSFGWVTEATARSSEYFRQCFLDVMIYPLLEIRDLITLHAACVVYNGKGILLAGDSGAGKSSLAYACARRGWTYVSDDASAFIRSSATPEVIGHPHKFRFREPVGQLFPEFLGLKSTLRAYGKPTIEVRTAALDHVRTADASSIDAIVFLNRTAYTFGPPILVQLDEPDAWQRLAPSVWAIDHPAFEERLNALRRLLERPIFEMRYRAFDPAIELLEDLAEGAFA
jgi:hypothetical protein